MTDHDTAEATAAFHHAVAGEFAQLERERSWRPGVRANATAAAVKRIDDAAAKLGAALADNARKATQTAVRLVGDLERRLDRAEAVNRDVASHLADMVKVNDALRLERNELRESNANMVGELAIARDTATIQPYRVGGTTVPDPLPQRVSQANAAIREVLITAAEASPAAPTTPAKPRSGAGSRPGRSQSAAKPKGGTTGPPARSKAAESSTEPPA